MRFSRQLVFASLAALAACKQPAPEAPAPLPIAIAAATPLDGNWTWRALSFSKGTVLEQRGRSATDCDVTCGREGQPRWSLATCVAGTADFKFLAEDCSTVLVLLEYPRKTDSWRTAPVLRVLRGANVIGEFRGAQLVADASRLKENGAHFRWLAGVLGEAGAPPRYLPDGRGVQFEAIDGKATTLDFAEVLVALAKAPAPPASPGAGGPYGYEDEAGELHFVDSLANVPPKYRQRAHAVQGDVNVMAGAANPKATNPAPWFPTGLLRRQPDAPPVEPAAPPAPPPAARPPSDGVERNELGETPAEYAYRIRHGLPIAPQSSQRARAVVAE